MKEGTNLFSIFSSGEITVLIRDFVASVGIAGVPLLLIFQILQISVAFIPGGIVEVVGGMLYGVFGGLIISLSGIVIGTIFTFYIARRFGKKLVLKIVKEENFKKYEDICSRKKFRHLVLFLFFLPGVPKDILIYVIGTGTQSVKFGIVASIVRIPSIIVSVYAGSLMGEGNLKAFLVVYGCFLVVGFLGIIIHNVILKLTKSKS